MIRVHLAAASVGPPTRTRCHSSLAVCNGTWRGRQRGVLGARPGGLARSGGAEQKASSGILVPAVCGLDQPERRLPLMMSRHSQPDGYQRPGCGAGGRPARWRRASGRTEALAEVKAEVNDPRSRPETRDAGRVTEPGSRIGSPGLVGVFLTRFSNFRGLGKMENPERATEGPTEPERRRGRRRFSGYPRTTSSSLGLLCFFLFPTSELEGGGT